MPKGVLSLTSGELMRMLLQKGQRWNVRRTGQRWNTDNFLSEDELMEGYKKSAEKQGERLAGSGSRATLHVSAMGVGKGVNDDDDDRNEERPLPVQPA